MRGIRAEALISDTCRSCCLQRGEWGGGQVVMLRWTKAWARPQALSQDSSSATVGTTAAAAAPRGAMCVSSLQRGARGVGAAHSGSHLLLYLRQEGNKACCIRYVGVGLLYCSVLMKAEQMG